MKAFLCIFLLLGLLAKAKSLTCTVCLNDGKTCLNTRNQECKPHEDTCISGVTEYIENGKQKFASFKSCLPSKACHAGYSSITVQKGKYIQSKAICCQKDLCNNVTVRLPRKSSSLNGLKCPSCFSVGSDHCRAKKTVRCTHYENRCVHFASTVTTGGISYTSALRGCATKTACAVRTGVLILADGQYVANLTRADCYPALSCPSCKG